MPLCNELISVVPQGCNYETASGIHAAKRQSIKRQARMKAALEKHCLFRIYVRELFKNLGEHGHSQQIQANNFTASFWDKGNEILNPISTAVKAIFSISIMFRKCVTENVC